MRRLLLVAAGAATMLCAAPAGAAVTCGSGFAIHERKGVRIFIAYRTPDSQPGMWGCTDRVRRPALLWESSPATTLAGGVERHFGRRVALDFEEYADGGNGRWLGWFDLRTGKARFTEVGGPRKAVDPEEDDSFTPPSYGLAVGRDGSIGYGFEAFGKTVELFAKPFADGRFGRQKAVTTVPAAEFDPATLAITSESLEWRTRGAASSVALPAAPPVAKARRGPLPRGLSCRAGQGLHLGNRFRVFESRRGVFACSENTKARPVTLAGRRGTLVLARETGNSLAFLVRERGRETLGVMDARNSSLRTRRRAAGPPEILALATRSNGGIAYVAETEAGRRVVYLAPSGTGLAAPVELTAPAAGGIEPRTLELTRAEVKWGAVGERRSAPRR